MKKIEEVFEAFRKVKNVKTFKHISVFFSKMKVWQQTKFNLQKVLTSWLCHWDKHTVFPW